MRAGALRQALRVGPRGWADLVVVSTLAVAVEILVRVRPLPEVARRFGCRLEGRTDATDRPPMTPTERRRRSIVEALMRHWPLGDRDGLCLRRSLLFGWVLRRRRPVLRIGVASRDGALSAHAWLEVQGLALGADAVHQPFTFGASPDPDGPA